MSSPDDHPPMLAKQADPDFSTARRSSRYASRGEPTLPPDSDPDATVERILALLSDGLYLPAKRLAAEATTRFPDHERVRWAWDIFDPRGKAAVGEGAPQPSRDEESAWLRDPPEWARGKWVALIGREAVAVAETLAELAASVRAQRLSRRPLVHHID